MNEHRGYLVPCFNWLHDKECSALQSPGLLVCLAGQIVAGQAAANFRTSGRCLVLGVRTSAHDIDVPDLTTGLIFDKC